MDIRGQIHNELHENEMWGRLYDLLIRAKKFLIKMENGGFFNEYDATTSALDFVLGTLEQNGYIVGAQTVEDRNHNKECLCGLAHYMKNSLEDTWITEGAREEIRRWRLVQDNLLDDFDDFMDDLCNDEDEDEDEYEDRRPNAYDDFFSQPPPLSNTGSEAAGGKPRKTGKRRKTGKKRKTSKKQRKFRKN